MSSVETLALLGAGVAWLGGFAAFGVVSIREREPRAAIVAFLLAFPLGLSLLAVPFLVPEALPWLARMVLGLVVLAAVAFVLPVGRVQAEAPETHRRVDEREIIFARARLVPGSEEFETYYAMHPEHREGDDRTRELPGLLSPDAAKADPTEFASARAGFEITETLRERVDGPLAGTRVDHTAEENTAWIKQLARQYGARAVGVTLLRPAHVYTHVGRGTGRWGDPVTLDHRFAVAFTVEMDYHVMRSAPEAPVVAESARQYVESARIAVQLASVMRASGWPARAHIDGNYRVIAPLVARDAGLGEIGRIGLLMTPRLGPRVRLGVVTTDLPLVPDASGQERSMIDFCTVCKKCAENCPSRSISFADREQDEAGLRWAIDADSCFRYWSAVGTDCGKCMTVCPYSHPDQALHNLVRFGMRRSGIARRAALWADDLFYGRQPKSRRPRFGGPTSEA